MSLTHFGEINFYIDGELGAEDVADIDARLARDPRERAIFIALRLQKDSLSKALETLEGACPRHLRTSQTLARLADVLMRRIAQKDGPPPDRSGKTEPPAEA